MLKLAVPRPIQGVLRTRLIPLEARHIMFLPVEIVRFEDGLAESRVACVLSGCRGGVSGAGYNYC